MLTPWDPAYFGPFYTQGGGSQICPKLLRLLDGLWLELTVKRILIVQEKLAQPSCNRVCVVPWIWSSQGNMNHARKTNWILFSWDRVKVKQTLINPKQINLDFYSTKTLDLLFYVLWDVLLNPDELNDKSFVNRKPHVLEPVYIVSRNEVQ